MVRDYVFNSEELVLLFVLIDSRHDLGAADLDFITDLGENGIPFSIIYTKCDKQGPNVLKAQIERNEARLLQEWEELPFSLCSSSQTGAGREEILAYIEQILNRIDQ